MKKITRVFVLAAAAVAALASCAKEVAPGQDNSGEGISVTITADATATKTVLDGLSPKWVDGDAIGLAKGRVNVKFDETSIPEGQTAATATFKGKLDEAGEYFAYYPYSTEGYSLLAGATYVNIPAVQNPTLESFDGKADILGTSSFTVTEGENNIAGVSFQRLTSVIKLVFSDPSSSLGGEKIVSASITSNSNPFAGTVGLMGLSFNGDSMKSDTKSYTVTAEYAENAQFAVNGSNAVWFSVYPSTQFKNNLVPRTNDEYFDGKLTFEATTASKKFSKEVTIPEDIKLIGGQIVTLNVKIEAENVSAIGAPAPVLSVSDPETVAAEGGEVSVSYSIENPVEGKTISAVAADSWVNGFDYSTPGTLKFNVDANAIGAKSTTIVVSYEGAEDKEITISQEAKTISSKATFKKVTSALEDYSGQYLIVYEGGPYVFDGNLTSTYLAGSNNMRRDGDLDPVEFSIESDSITIDPEDYNLIFNVSKKDDAYSIQSYSGLYIYMDMDGNNAMRTSDKSVNYSNTFSINADGSAQITSSGAVLRFRGPSFNCFKYYSSSKYTTYNPVSLYKLEKSGSEPTPSDGSVYEKVTENLDDFSGQYLLVSEDTGYIFDGSRDDNISSGLGVSNNMKRDEDNDPIEYEISVNTITLTKEDDDQYFIIEKVEGGYAIKSASGFYIYGTGNNTIKTASEFSSDYVNQVSVDDSGNAVISVIDDSGNNFWLRYRPSWGFRYYNGISKFSAVSLYKKK